MDPWKQCLLLFLSFVFCCLESRMYQCTFNAVFSEVEKESSEHIRLLRRFGCFRHRKGGHCADTVSTAASVHLNSITDEHKSCEIWGRWSERFTPMSPVTVQSQVVLLSVIFHERLCMLNTRSCFLSFIIKCKSSFELCDIICDKLQPHALMKVKLKQVNILVQFKFDWVKN